MRKGKEDSWEEVLTVYEWMQKGGRSFFYIPEDIAPSFLAHHHASNDKGFILNFS
jgi:hypothetical protein